MTGDWIMKFAHTGNLGGSFKQVLFRLRWDFWAICHKKGWSRSPMYHTLSKKTKVTLKKNGF